MKSNSAPVLADLAKHINIAHGRARKAAKASLERAIEAGEYLLEAKECVGHGEWLEWLSDNVTFSDRTAQAYMRLARHKDEISKSATVADLTLRGGIDAITNPRPRDVLLAFYCQDVPGPHAYKSQFLFIDDKGNELRPARATYYVQNGEKSTCKQFQRPLPHKLLLPALDIEIQSCWTDAKGQPFIEWRDLPADTMAEIVAAL